MITTFPDIDVKTPPSVKVFYLDSGIAIFGVPSDPEGIVTAFPGSFAIDIAGNWYRKASGLGNVGWVGASFGSVANLTRRIEVNLATVGNTVGAGLKVLHTFTLPANSLPTNEDYLKVRYTGVFANNANTKRIRISFGGQTVDQSGLFTIQNQSWSYDIEYYRVSATSIRCSIRVMWGIISRDLTPTLSGNCTIYTTSVLIPVADLSANTMAMTVEGESGAAAANDVIQEASKIEINTT